VPPDQIAAANGAGDAFAAGTLYGLHQGWRAGDALALGRAAAAASLRGLSTTGTVVPWRECLELARMWGVRQGMAAGA
jgi:sugar/nucleoside kinase (ribokinase family)